MENKRCAKCGRIFPSSYQKCPYCSGQGRSRRARPSSPLERFLSLLQENRDRVFLSCTVLFLFIAVLGMLLTQCPDTAAKPEETPKPSPQEPVEQDPEPTVEPLALSQTAISLFVGETGELTASGGEGTIIWSSSDSTVASVSNGVITGKAAGSATVTASCGLQKVSCAVTVQVKSPDVDVYLNRTDFTLRSNDPPFQMKVMVVGSRTLYDGAIVWSSEDPAVASVSETGLVERTGRGSTVIKATMGEKVLECIVRVS